MIAPGIYYDHGLTGVTDSENRDLNSTMVQVDIRHPF